MFGGDLLVRGGVGVRGAVHLPAVHAGRGIPRPVDVDGVELDVDAGGRDAERRLAVVAVGELLRRRALRRAAPAPRTASSLP